MALPTVSFIENFVQSNQTLKFRNNHKGGSDQKTQFRSLFVQFCHCYRRFIGWCVVLIKNHIFVRQTCLVFLQYYLQTIYQTHSKRLLLLFSFFPSNQSGSLGLLGYPEQQWPRQNGFGIFCWIFTTLSTLTKTKRFLPSHTFTTLLPLLWLFLRLRSIMVNPSRESTTKIFCTAITSLLLNAFLVHSVRLVSSVMREISYLSELGRHL